tara:strand:+ start:147900 stop:148466 length:567 start_codon:yes stop_codon:yes gene_type:complete
MDLTPIIPKLVYTFISIVVLLVLRVVLLSIVKRIAIKNQNLDRRTKLITKYFDFAIIFLLVFWNILIWGVQFRDVGLVFSSVFAIIGVALFAQWSILSNITSGIIMFFTFPYKIGDTIKIHDKDFVMEPLVIDDINAFQMILRSEKGEVLSYPNNLLLQKGITLLSESNIIPDKIEEPEEKNLTQTHD